MNQINRRNFLKYGILGTAAATMSFPAVSGRFSNIIAGTKQNTILRPYPHPWMPKMDFVYLADENEDPFKSEAQITQDGIVIPENVQSKFSINAKWFIEGFGFIWLSANNGGQFYSSGNIPSGASLNYEFARSRVARNKDVMQRYEKQDIQFSPEVKHLAALSEELLNDAGKKIFNPETSASLSDRSLEYALWTGEKIELEYAEQKISEQNRRDKVYFGCESRQYIWAKSEDFTKRFIELMNFSTLTHYVWDSWYELFEPREGYYNWGVKDNIVNWLSENNITIQGRPLFWFHPTVTPEWLKNKNFDELKKYIDKHTKDVVLHYGDKVLQWEVVNEYHDWANIHNHSVDQITEITRQACDRTKEVNPKVTRIINNCCPWAEYAARGRMARMDATRPLRSPRKYMEDLTKAGVDYDVLGVQVYFPQRDLSDIVRLIERFETFGKPIYITEIGASAGVTNGAIQTGETTVPNGPYDWHRHWDEELQADWLEQVYKIYYARPLIKAINWYDFSDFRPFIRHGGLVREDSTPKLSYFRMKEMLEKWNRIPDAATKENNVWLK